MELTDNTLHIAFIHPYFASYYFQTYKKDLENLAHACLGPQIIFAYSNCFHIPETANKVKPETEKDAFEDFISSAKNQPALAAAHTACSDTPEKFFLLLHGPSDCGKTHLLACIKDGIAASRGCGAIACSRASEFSPWEGPEHFWSKPRALLLDDLHEMTNRQQERLTAYMDASEQSGNWRRMVFTIFGATHQSLSERLANRLKKALAIELFQPDLPVRIAWLEKTADPGLNLTRHHILAMARHTPRISGLAGLLQKLEFYARLTGRIISPEELEKLAAPADRPAAWQCIVNRVSEKLEVRPLDIMGSSRRHDYVLARQMAMFLCRQKLGLSYPELGRLFGGKDHSTVMHGIKKIEQLRLVDTDLHKLLTELENAAD